MRVVVLVDGEHYPAVVRAAVGNIRAGGDDVVAAVFLGGTEKLVPGDLDASYGIALEQGAEREAVLRRVLDEHHPDAVVDLSDVPVVSADDRFRLATVALLHGAAYRGPDFELRPPRFERILTKPSIRVIATGKRTGKTAVAGALARHAAAKGYQPVIVAMGRGGPEDPAVVEAGSVLGPHELLSIADAGNHAASDYLEDAVTSRVTTIGCRRVGGGLAGAVHESNVVAGARIAEIRPENVVILEGSGAAIPPVAAGAGLICIPAWADAPDVTHYLGPYRLLLSDLAVVTMAEKHTPSAELATTIRGVSRSIEVIRTVFRPRPLSRVSERRVFYCCTAPLDAGAVISRHLEEAHGCEVVGMSHALADRAKLEEDLSAAPAYDTLLTELKAGAVDVAVRTAAGAGKEIVFADNELVGDGVEGALDRLLSLAATRSL